MKLEDYQYITPTVESSDPGMVRAIDGWLGLYEACYVLKRLWDEGQCPQAGTPAPPTRVRDDAPEYGMNSAERPRPEHLLAAVMNAARALNEWGGPWALGGGLALNFHGYERATRDVDFFLLADKDKLQPVFEAFARHDVMRHSHEKPSFMPPDAQWWWVPLQFRLPDAAPVNVDLLVAAHEFMAFLHATGRESDVNGLRVRLIGPEGLIVLKLAAYRDQDKADLQQLLNKAPALNMDLIRAWAARFKWEERLAEMERQAALNRQRRG